METWCTFPEFVYRGTEASMDHSEPTKPSLGLRIQGRAQLDLPEPT